MARTGLYDELVKRNLLDRGAAIALGAGSDPEKAEALDLLLAEAGSDFRATPRAAFILRHKLEAKGYQVENGSHASAQENDARAASSLAPKTNLTASQKKGGAPKGNRNAAGNRGGPGGPPGNDHATKTGATRNPLLHAVSRERAAMVEVGKEEDEAELLSQSIELYRLTIIDMTEEIEAIRASPKRWWWLGSTYRRLEGDGELMGTGRISERKRHPREEALKIMIEARAKVQARMDKAIKDRAEIRRNAKPTPPGAGTPEGIDYSKLTVEELRDLERLLAKAAQP